RRCGLPAWNDRRAVQVRRNRSKSQPVMAMATGLQYSRRCFRQLFSRLLVPGSEFGRLRQPVTDFGTIETDVSQISVARPPPDASLRLTLPLGDHCGNQTIDEAGKPENEISD